MLGRVRPADVQTTSQVHTHLGHPPERGEHQVVLEKNWLAARPQRARERERGEQVTGGQLTFVLLEMGNICLHATLVRNPRERNPSALPRHTLEARKLVSDQDPQLIFTYMACTESTFSDDEITQTAQFVRRCLLHAVCPPNPAVFIATLLQNKLFHESTDRGGIGRK